ncbi:MAG: universal stress protein [Nitrosopumilus sp.]|nr:universal stress protein [Nitrosopumilus sp.]MDH3737167.1 universal stress protein [Nitrosopumilus sp.]MDH3832657.1 universal stress protein [Nitrosopumilus sp.]
MGSNTLNKILVPLDGSKNSLRGMKFAAAVANQSGSSIIGLNINSPPMFVKASVTLRNQAKLKSKEIIKEAEAITQKANVSFRGITKVSNNVGKTIVTFAEGHQVDMIVIGSRGPDSEHELFLGSTANYVVIKSKIPVTIIK